MSGLFSRLFKITQSQAHSAVDKIEDPIKMIEQGIRDLKKDLDSSLTSLAEVKSIAIRMGKEAEQSAQRVVDYERKAMLLLQRGQGGQIDMAEAERLATEAIIKKEEHEKKAQEAKKQYEDQNKMVEQLQGNITTLKAKISSYENQTITLKARSKTAESVKKLNKQMAQIDSSGTIAMLERMKARVEEDESLAAAYGDIVAPERSLDEQINAALVKTESGATDAADKLAEMKAKLGITK
ncbi:MAG TPA: PspA/IM30 family protein [Thermodesulfovibrionia bacterium]|nr:PspA/IM30 family protein [Thermodesulfovibrionia bacterium]